MKFCLSCTFDFTEGQMDDTSQKSAHYGGLCLCLNDEILEKGKSFLTYRPSRLTVLAIFPRDPRGSREEVFRCRTRRPWLSRESRRPWRPLSKQDDMSE